MGVVLDHVDAPRAGLGGAFVVDEDLAGDRIDGHGTHDVDHTAVGQVEHGRRPVGTGGQLADAGASGLLRPGDDLVCEVFDVVEPVGVAQGGEPLPTDLARCHLGVEIAGHVIGLANVGEDELPHLFVAFTGLHQLDDRDPQTFFEDVSTTGTDAVATDVGVVDRRTEVSDRLAVTPDGDEHGDVEELTGGEVRIIGDQHVARLERLRRELGEDVGGADGQRVDVAGGTGDGLGHHAPTLIEDGVGEVACLSHDRTEGRALECPSLLVDGRDEALPENLELDGVEGLGHA